ncbi:RNA polymerase sigma-70 factor [Chitinophaga silvatica]|uniref:RNA polymerase sigma-70 factor n=1 Tax=Chitinophaga silvatica TaxID=2282649 RepID=A0A3E1Y295_9BACT|nr:RNA polymerase sigma-70 factor [Chitinophaga silvatica]RFS18805.1 RNA polymerase sigma-70 factor [Chitinophaga silvatica]
MFQPDINRSENFEELFRLHYSNLCVTAYYVVGDEETAKDIVQDFFLYCWNKRNALSIANFASYASRSVRNASLNYIKKAGRIDFEPPETIVVRAEQIPDEDYQPDESKNAALWAAISRLPEQRQRIFLMSNKDELKYKDIADKLGISINTVKTQIKLAYQFLRKECDWVIKILIFINFLP